MNIKYMGENAISYLIEKCKSTFALITHKHTAQEVGADVEGSASAALVLAQQHTDEQIATHEHSWNDLEDKPFYTSYVENVLLEEIEVFVYKAGIWAWISENQFILEEGKTYKVVFNGVTYECVAYSSVYGVVIGNLAPMGLSSGNNEPFAIRSQNLCTASGGTYTVSVAELQENFVTLSEDFIPDTIARTEYVDENFALKSDLQNIDLSALETKTDSQSKLDEAKAYADSAASTVKDDLLNGAGDAYDTLLELGVLIDENHDAIDALREIASNKSDKGHTHTMESIDGLQDAVNAAADSKFYVVTFDADSNGQYHGDLTFAQIREKFEAGGNMVARIDGTDYIPLLSAATHQIIFSGIYQATSVSLTVGSNDVCTLTSTSLARSNHNHPIATTSTNGFMSSADKTKLDGIDISKYETKEDAQVKYDEILANQFTVQMITWEADD